MRGPTTPVEPVQKGENAICRKLIPVLRPKTKIIQVAQHTLTLVIFNHVALYSMSVLETTLRAESAHFLQRHAGMNLVDVDCELVLDALHLKGGGQRWALSVGMG